MKAMILAAGKGERMRPLTDHTPKPLLVAGTKPLIVYHLERLAAAGIDEVVINIAYLGEQLREALGGGEQWGVKIIYSEEPEPLETGGAVLHAATALGDAPFLLINGDIWSDFPLRSLLAREHIWFQPDSAIKGHLVMVPNPPQHRAGDFAIDGQRLQHSPQSAGPATHDEQTYTFSGISVLSPELITNYPRCRRVFPLGEVFRYAIDHQWLGAELYSGQWFDIGTPERLAQLDKKLKASS